MANLIPMLLEEMEQEAKTTRKMLSRIPEDRFDWQPHPKSMTLLALATHIAELPEWVEMALTTNELDFETSSYAPTPIKSTAELLTLLENSLKKGKESLENATESQLNEPWVLRSGEQILFDSTRAGTIRMTYCQIVHHRAQLGVDLRLLDIPIPGSYGPSADDPSF